MDTTDTSTPPKLPTDLGAARPGLDPMAGSSVVAMRPSLGERASRGLLIFSIGSAPLWLGSRMAMQPERCLRTRRRSLAGWRHKQHPWHRPLPAWWCRPQPILLHPTCNSLRRHSPPYARAWISSQRNSRLASNRWRTTSPNSTQTSRRFFRSSRQLRRSFRQLRRGRPLHRRANRPR